MSKLKSYWTAVLCYLAVAAAFISGDMLSQHLRNNGRLFLVPEWASPERPSQSNTVVPPLEMSEDMREQHAIRLLLNWVNQRHPQVPGELAMEVVLAAMSAGRTLQLDPALLLAVASKESSLNPKAIGKADPRDKGLMQVNTRWNHQIIEQVGGIAQLEKPAAAFLAGGLVLKKCFERQSSHEGAVQCYHGIGKNPSYAPTVLAKYEEIKRYLRDVL